MALTPTRFEVRVALSDVERGVSLEETVITARHPSETAEHLMLRVLAYCLLYREGLVFGPGLCDGEASDLEARDAAGRVTLWVECGAVEATKLRRIVQQHAEAEVHVILCDERRRRELLDGIAALPHGIKDRRRVTLWRIDPVLVAALARNEARRQRWSLTVVGGHLYLDIHGDGSGESLDGEVSAEALE